MAAGHDLSWAEVIGPVVRPAFVAGRCVVLVVGQSPRDQKTIAQREVRMEGSIAVMSIQTGSGGTKGSNRSFQLAVPTATPGLDKVVFGPERTVIWEKTSDSRPCGD